MILSLLACTQPVPDVTPMGDDPVVRAVRMGALRGYAVQEGRLQAFDAARCDELIEELGHCLGNNPTTPYVTAFLDDFEAPFGRVTLDQDQALVFIGRTPPESYYYSLNAAVHERIYDGAVGTPVGSVAASLHHGVIAADGVFDAPMVVVATANRAVAQDLRRGLRPLLDQAGLPDVVNVIELPWQPSLDAIEADPAYEDITVVGLRLGHDEGADRFSFTWRVAGADPSHAFFAGETQTVFRVSPREAVPALPWTYPLLPPVRDNSHPPPAELAAGMRALAERLSADAEERGNVSVRLRFEETTFDGFRCINRNIPCGNSDDALYAGSVKLTLPEGDAGVFVVGAIHPDVPTLGGGPPLAYSNLNLQNADEQRALRGWTHDELRGSARDHYPGGLSGVSSAVFDLLYIREVSRSCVHADCVAFDEPAGTQLNFLERAYLDLSTNTGPHPDSIVESRVVIHGPRIVPRVLEGYIDVLL